MTDPVTFDARVPEAAPPGPPEVPAGPGHIVVSRAADAAALLRSPACVRDSRAPVIAALLGRGGRSAEPLLRLARINLQSEDGEPHRHKRRFTLQLASEMVAAWPARRIFAAQAKLLDAAAEAGVVDLHTCVSVPLCGLVIGERLGLPPEALAQLAAEVLPIFEATLPVWQRLAELDEVAARAECAMAIITRMTSQLPPVPGVDPAELPLLAVVATVPGFALMTEALTRAQLAVMRDPALAARLAAEDDLLGPFLTELLRVDPPGRFTMPTRIAATVELSDGTSLPAGRNFVCDIRRANRDPAQGALPEVADLTRPRGADFTFGHGPHRCVGAGLTLVTLEAALRCLVQGYRLLPAGEVLASEHLIGLRHTAVPVRVERRAQTT